MESSTQDIETNEVDEAIKISLNQELTINSMNKNGIKIVVPEEGRYRFSIVEGAYTVYQKEQNKG